MNTDEKDNNIIEVANECICDENGIHYICPICKKLYKDDLDASLCCIKDK